MSQKARWQNVLEVTFKSGAQVEFEVSKGFEVRVNALGEFVGLKNGVPWNALRVAWFIDPTDVSAVILIRKLREGITITRAGRNVFVSYDGGETEIETEEDESGGYENYTEYTTPNTSQWERNQREPTVPEDFGDSQSQGGQRRISGPVPRNKPRFSRTPKPGDPR